MDVPMLSVFLFEPTCDIMTKILTMQTPSFGEYTWIKFCW